MGGLLLLARLIKLSLALEQSEPQSVPRRKPGLSSGGTAPPAAHSRSLLQDLLTAKGLPVNRGSAGSHMGTPLPH